MLTLALRAPEHLSRVAFIDGDDFGGAENRALYVAEQTPLHVFGLSHFLVLRKVEGSATRR